MATLDQHQFLSLQRELAEVKAQVRDGRLKFSSGTFPNDSTRLSLDPARVASSLGSHEETTLFHR